MSERFYQFECPCCSKRVEFDPRTGKARAVTVQDAKASKDFDAFLADQQTESKRLESVFGQAVDQQKKEKNTLSARREPGRPWYRARSAGNALPRRRRGCHRRSPG